MFCGTDVLPREVSQKSISALPCCMGSIFFCDPHPAWEHDFCTLRHLPSEKPIFSCFQHLPSENHKNQQKSHFEAMVWTCRRGSRQKQIGSKSSPSSLKYDRDAFFKSPKIQQIDSRMRVIPKEYQQLRLRRLHARFANFIEIHQNHTKIQ